MNVLILLLYGVGSPGRVKLTPEEKALLPYIWIAFISIVVGSVYFTYRSWKKNQNRN